MRVLKFSASWCQPCKALAEQMKDIATENIDIDENTGLAVKYGIRGVPTLVVLDDSDKEIKRMSGVRTNAELKEWLK